MNGAFQGLHDDWRGRKRAISELASVDAQSRAVTAERLVELLAEENLDLGVLNGALQSLVALGRPALDRLQPLLLHTSPEVRQAAAVIFAQLEGLLGVPSLLQLLSDRDVNVRYHAIEALGQKRALVAVPRLLEIAYQEDAFLGFAAVEALAHIGDAAALPDLVGLLDQPLLGGSAAEALGRIGHPLAIKPLTAQLANLTEAPAAVEALVRANPGLVVFFRPEQRQILLSRGCLSALEREGELAAAELLASVPDALLKEIIATGARPNTLQWALQNGSEEVRLAAAEAIPDFEALVEFLPAYPERAAAALGRTGRVEAMVPIVGELGNPSVRVRSLLLAEGARLGTPEELLRPLLLSSDATRRSSAARWLAGAGLLPPGWVEAESEERVRCEVLEALPATPDTLALWQRRLQQGTPAEAVVIVRLLADFPAEQGLAVLKAVPPNHDLWYCVHLCRTLGRWMVQSAWLAEMLDDLRPPVRSEAAKALAVVDPQLAEVRLPSLLLDAELDVAEAALLALAEMGCWEVVRQALEEPRLRPSALAALAHSPLTADLIELPWDRLLETRNPAALAILLEHLEQLSCEQLERLRQLLADTGWRPEGLPRQGLRLLSRVCPDYSAQLFQDADAWVRRSALVENFSQLAESACQDADDRIRHFAAQVCG